MAVEPLSPSGLLWPDYQSADGYRRDVWPGRLRVAAILLAGVLLVAAAWGGRLGVRRWQAHREQVRADWAVHQALLADEALCMSYAAPPRQTVYSERTGEVESMLREPDCFPLEWGAGPSRFCNLSPALPSNAGLRATAAGRVVMPALSYSVSSGGTAFVGRRRSPGGADRLVVVEARPTDRPASTQARSLEFTSAAYVATGPKPGQTRVLGAIDELSVPVAPGAHARVLAGQRDPTDPARFTIDYELDGAPGTIFGRLNDDGRVSLQLKP
jgi:hypothetical protein